MKIPSTTLAVVLLLIVLVSQVKVPMCYGTPEGTPEEQQPKEPVFYETKIINTISQQIKESPFYIKIIGESMYPSIESGDTCICTSQEDYKEGDVVSFYVPAGDGVELIAHRIISENNNQFTTKGDSNNIQDSWVINKDQIFCQIPEGNLFEKFKFGMNSKQR